MPDHRPGATGILVFAAFTLCGTERILTVAALLTAAAFTRVGAMLDRVMVQ